MRNTYFSLLFAVAAPAFASPVPFNVTIASTTIACSQGINRAQALTDASGGVRFHWSIANGVIVDGADASAVTFTPVDGGNAVLTVTVEWLGTKEVRQLTLPVFDPPTILRQPQSMTVLPGTSVTLSTASSDEVASYDWFEGASGDTSKIVSAGAIAYKTPALTKPAQYWVRVNGRCGVVNSQTANISFGKRRSTGR